MSVRMSPNMTFFSAIFFSPPKPRNLSHVPQHQETRAALKTSSDAI